MNNSPMPLLAVLLMLLACAPLGAEERPIAGQLEKGELVVAGAKEAVTAPGAIVRETSEDMNNFGAGAIITGPVVGGIKGAGQALLGGGRMLIGIMDVLTAPIRESSYNRDQVGGLR